MTLKIIVNFRFTQTYRVAEVVRRYEGSSTKSSYLYENCRDIKICCDLPTFWKSLGNKVPFGSNTVFLRQEVNYYMVYIAYYTELNLQICNYAKRRICRENCKFALDESFHGHFCPWRKAAKLCHPGLRQHYWNTEMNTAQYFSKWIHRVSQKSDFQNAARATVHPLNHQ